MAQRHQQSFLLNQSSGEAVLRDPKKKEGARRFDLPAGVELPAIERETSLEMCGQFSHGRKNYHTNKEASAELGFQDLVVGGKMTVSMVGEVLQGGLGSPCANGGKLLVNFTNSVWPNETVRARDHCRRLRTAMASLVGWRKRTGRSASWLRAASRTSAASNGCQGGSERAGLVGALPDLYMVGPSCRSTGPRVRSWDGVARFRSWCSCLSCLVRAGDGESGCLWWR